MTSSVYLIFALLACIGTICSAEMVTCYKCFSDESNPKNSPCWKDAALNGTEVSCDSYCYSETFQSGGPSNDANYWFIRRDCADSDDGTCTESDNCKNEAWGACKRCCYADRCNTDSPSSSNMVKASILVALSAAILTKWIN